MTLQNYYHLRKASFSISPNEDAAIYFGSRSLDTKLRERLETDFNQPRQVPKFGLYGPYGAGKTHTLAHLQYVLSTVLAGEYPSESIMLDISPIKAKESWRKVHADAINAIGLDRLRSAINAILTRPEAAGEPLAYLRKEDILRFGEAGVQASQAKVFRALMFGGSLESAALEWLKGGSVTATDAAALGVETKLTDTSHLAAALLNCASVLKAGSGKSPILMIDEGEALRSLSNADSIGEFTSGLRRLADDENNVLGLIIAFQTEGSMEEEAPEVITDEAVYRRFDYSHGFFDLSEVIGELDDVRNFIDQILAYLIDQGAAAKTIAAEGLGIEPEYFPFTEEAIDRLAQFVSEGDPADQVPSQIIHRMRQAVVRGWQRGKDDEGRRLIDEDLMEEVLYPEES